ncbi:MAG TPA: bifunctional tetrahydrofolate synthase/dihydrofolate synthase, partial [Cellvibrionaceae bacterium]
MSFSSLPEWLAWMEQCHPREIELGLERVSQVAERMGLPGGGRHVIVAGTNGKGSCVATISALLQRAGLKVGAYTSPHLLRYNERVCINGQPVDDDSLCHAFGEINRAQGDISLTYFEFGTLAALYIFKQQRVDVSVLEVGLGGRLDAVNLVDADVAVVTSIAIDHEAWLGRNREVIGREKAGIFRANVPAICADPEPPNSVEETAKRLGARWLAAGDSFQFGRQDDGLWWWQGGRRLDSLPVVHLPLPSVAAALLAVEVLGIELDREQIVQTLEQLTLPGRMQTLAINGRWVILDVAHNPAATTYLAANLVRPAPPGRVFALVAMMADKDLLGSLQPLLGQVDVWCCASLEGVARAAPAATLGNGKCTTG